jgi:hypothetical protein
MDLYIKCFNNRMMQRIAKYQYGIDSDFRLKFILVLDRLTMFLYKDLTTIVNINKLYLQNRNYVNHVIVHNLKILKKQMIDHIKVDNDWNYFGRCYYWIGQCLETNEGPLILENITPMIETLRIKCNQLDYDFIDKYYFFDTLTAYITDVKLY